METLPIALYSGRLPQNSSEILIPASALDRAGAELALGDTLTLSLGERVLGGRTLGQTEPYTPGERLTDKGTKRYTVVGICLKLEFADGYRDSAAAFPCVTRREDGEAAGDAARYSVFVKLNAPRTVHRYAEARAAGAAVVYNDMRIYKQLTYTDRLRIEKWLNEKYKPLEIAAKLRVHHSTIYRELKRGEYERLDGDTWRMVKAYSPDIAEAKYQENLRAKGPELKIGHDFKLARYIEKTILEKDCSPAAVLGYAQNEGRKFDTKVSTQTIYRYIKNGLFLRITQKDLPRHGKHKRKYKKVKKQKAARAPAGESIEKRPEAVNSREEFGHWEMDTVYSGKSKSTRALLVLTERKTRKEIVIGVPNRKAQTIVRAIDALERRLGAAKFRKIFKSITMDNGTEFSAADDLEKSCINKKLRRTKVYFCHPYSSWERGSNENQNHMIRRKFPKGTNFAKVNKEQVAEAENWVNNYSRGIFGLKSSEIMYMKCLSELGLKV